MKETVQGGPAIDVELYDLAEKSTVKLFDFMKTNRPLVLNFGSCTWPPFMASVKKFGALSGEFSDIADFVAVYISEGKFQPKICFLQLKQVKTKYILLSKLIHLKVEICRRVMSSKLLPMNNLSRELKQLKAWRINSSLWI